MAIYDNSDKAIVHILLSTKLTEDKLPDAAKKHLLKKILKSIIRIETILSKPNSMNIEE